MPLSTASVNSSRTHSTHTSAARLEVVKGAYGNLGAHIISYCGEICNLDEAVITNFHLDFLCDFEYSLIITDIYSLYTQKYLYVYIHIYTHSVPINDKAVKNKGFTNQSTIVDTTFLII